MVRSLILLLLLMVVFLSGMLLGIDREQQTESNDFTKVQQSSDIKDKVTDESTMSVEQINREQVIDMETTPHFTQKAAFLLEAAVKGFYEIIVEILYQFSKLFF